MFQIARSAHLPASSVPVSDSSPSARAASRVVPAMHSSTVMPNSVAAMFIVRSSEVSGDVPGLQSVATAIFTPCSSKQPNRRLLRLANEVVGAGQDHRDGAGPGHRRGAPLVGVFEMIGRQRAEARGKFCAVQIGELIGVKLHRQAERFRDAEDPGDLIRENAMPSQNPSTASARPTAAIAGNISSTTFAI